MEHYSGEVTISDGTHESTFDVEIHTRQAENSAVAAWHVIVQGHLPPDLRIPPGKALAVVLPDGSRGVGTLVDPHIIRGVGEPPS
jgi:hypothetical protein